MIKIIFYFKNLKQVKSLCNNVINIFENLQIVGIATKEKELYSLFKNTNANMIIYKFEDVNNTKTLNFLNNFSTKIIFHNSMKKYENNNHTLFLDINSNFSNIQKQLAKFILKNDEPIIYQKVLEILKNLNFNFKLKGTFFLLNCITYSFLNKDKYVSENLEKNVYPKIAKQFNSSITTVKWSIIRAINDVNFYSEKQKLIGEKLTTKALINEILNKLN